VRGENPANVYRFEDKWEVPFSAERVWGVLSRPEDYPRCCRGVISAPHRWMGAQGSGFRWWPKAGCRTNPRVETPLVKILSLILKPIFRWNHDWTMKRGERQIAAYLGGSFERN
jgi:hypothetical protein